MPNPIILRANGRQLDNGELALDVRLWREEGGAFARATAEYCDGHYVLNEWFEADDLHYFISRATAPQTFDITHTAAEAYRRIYNRMLRRGRRIAKRENTVFRKYVAPHDLAGLLNQI
jgi:hypothetical protein